MIEKLTEADDTQKRRALFHAGSARRELIAAQTAVVRARQDLEKTGMFSDATHWGAVLRALDDKAIELQASIDKLEAIEALTGAIEGPREQYESYRRMNKTRAALGAPQLLPACDGIDR